MELDCMSKKTKANYSNRPDTPSMRSNVFVRARYGTLIEKNQQTNFTERYFFILLFIAPACIRYGIVSILVGTVRRRIDDNCLNTCFSTENIVQTRVGEKK